MSNPMSNTEEEIEVHGSTEEEIEVYGDGRDSHDADNSSGISNANAAAAEAPSTDWVEGTAVEQERSTQASSETVVKRKEQGLRRTSQELEAKLKTPKVQQPSATADDGNSNHKEANKGLQRGLKRSSEELEAKQKARTKPSITEGTTNPQTTEDSNYKEASNGLQRGLRRSSEELEAKQNARSKPADSRTTEDAISKGLHRGLRRTPEELDAKRSARDGRDRAQQAAVIHHSGNIKRGLRKSGRRNQPNRQELGLYHQRATPMGTEPGEMNLLMEEGLCSTAMQMDDSRSQQETRHLHEVDVDEVDVDDYQDSRSAGNTDAAMVTPTAVHQPPSIQVPVATDHNLLSADDLVEARPVEDDGMDVDRIMQAEEVDPADLERKALKEKKERQCRWIGFILILASIAAVLGAVLGRDASGPSPTLAPSLAPSSESPSLAPTSFLDLLVDQLPSYTVESIQGGTTPQWKAMHWLEEHPELPILPEWRKIQLFALATFFYAMEGPNWPKEIKDDWMLYTKSECFWFGGEFGVFLGEDLVLEDNAGGKQWFDGSKYEIGNDTDPCNEQGEIRSLLLFQLGLSSYSPFIPAEITLLTSLSMLSLPLNGINHSLTSFLPSQMYGMTNLTVLNLHSNSFTGYIPQRLGLLSNLESIHLVNNSLVGAIPSEVGLLTALTDLSLYLNELTGSLPSEMGLMKGMEELWLHSNALSGTLHSQLGSMKNMTQMYLYDNRFSGPIPSELGLMTNMVYCYLYSNKLSGRIPTQLGWWTSIIELSLPANQLTGPVPSELALMAQLESLKVFSNSLFGSLPTELGLMGHLKSLEMGDNSLTGSIPSQLALIRGLEELDLGWNRFAGSIPSHIGLMGHLNWLRMGDNSLTGSIPS